MPSVALAPIVSPVRLMESWGRRIVMDTGFGAVLVRFEQAFGKHITNFILALIGIATTTVCCAVIWKLALGPAVAWLSGLSLTARPIVPEVVEVAWYAGGFAFGFAIVRLITASLERNKLRAEVGQLTEQRDALAEEIEGIEAALDEAGV